MKFTGAPRRISRAALVAAVAAGALALLPGAASAATFHPCSSGSIVRCGRVIVPIDPSGAVKGSMSLHVELLHTHGPNHGAMIALAGGPGQAATPLLPDFAATLDPVLRGRDLVVFDQRGTGFSDQLLCPGLGNHKLPDSGVGACAQRLGALRPFYSTSASVADLEAVRRAIGVAKIDLYGVSYGTKVALDYATRFPQNIDRLVLDSVVMPGALDPYELSSFAALPRLLAQICAKDACKGITTDPRADLAQLVQKLQSSSPSGFVVNGHGKRRKADLRRSGILSVLFEGDFDPTLRADFPAAVRSALNGDYAPMLRLVAATTGAETFDPSTGDSQALFLATSCEDAVLPWSQSATPSQRLALSRQAFAQIARSSYAPFDPDTVFNFSLAPFCATWPESGDSPPVESAGSPAVPTLILSGDDDLRTPQEDAMQIAAQLPKATLVKVPNVGHSVLGDDFSSCSLRALQRFFHGQPSPACQSRGPLIPPSPVPPTSLSQLPSVTHQPRKVGRTLAALQDTLADMSERAFDAFLSSSDGVSIAPTGGLRAGWFSADAKALTLHGYSWVPGVTVSGRIPLHGNARIVVGGRAAARGTLTITQRGRISGRLGGHRVKLRLGAASVARAQATAAVLRQRAFTPFASSVLPPG